MEYSDVGQPEANDRERQTQNVNPLDCVFVAGRPGWEVEADSNDGMGRDDEDEAKAAHYGGTHDPGCAQYLACFFNVSTPE